MSGICSGYEAPSQRLRDEKSSFRRSSGVLLAVSQCVKSINTGSFILPQLSVGDVRSCVFIVISYRVNRTHIRALLCFSLLVALMANTYGPWSYIGELLVGKSSMITLQTADGLAIPSPGSLVRPTRSLCQ